MVMHARPLISHHYAADWAWLRLFFPETFAHCMNPMQLVAVAVASVPAGPMPAGPGQGGHGAAKDVESYALQVVPEAIADTEHLRMF